MESFDLGLYWRVPSDVWEEFFDGVIAKGDFFEYDGYYYILDEKYDTEYDDIIENDLLDYMDEYLYLSSSIHFGS